MVDPKVLLNTKSSECRIQGGGSEIDIAPEALQGSFSSSSETSEGASKIKHGRVRFNSSANTIRPSVMIESEKSATIETIKQPLRSRSPPLSILRTGAAPITMLDQVENQAEPLDSKPAEVTSPVRAVEGTTTARRHTEAPAESISHAREATNSGRRGSNTKSARRNSDFVPVADVEKIDIEAHKLVRTHTRNLDIDKIEPDHSSSRKNSAVKNTTANEKPDEVIDGTVDGVYAVPPPQQYRGGVLSDLLRLYKPSNLGHHANQSSSTVDAPSSPGHLTKQYSESGPATPSRRKWYEQERSQETLVNLVEASTRLADFAQDPKQEPISSRLGKKSMHARISSVASSNASWQKEEARITVHIADTLARQEFIVKLCHALMLYGAPTHRLEEYLTTVAQALEIDGKFLYMPGCMLVSFDDRSTHTTEVQLVRLAQGINLGKLKEVHRIYKEIMHDVIDASEAIDQLQELSSRRDQFHPWIRVLVFGLTSVAASPFSFKARLIDLPLLFCFGCIVGILQLIVAARSPLYSNVFEVSATVLISFLARAFGSIRGGSIFCFSALAQGGIVMLLPGYMVLCSSLELQSRAIIPGSLRIVYAIVYSLLLGYGITVGAALYGLLDDNATHSITCSNPINPYLSFLFVPFFVVCISVLYQARWRQMPSMVVIAFAGYIVNYFSSIRFVASPQIASTLGALAVGVLANFYSRIRHSVAAATLIPAIFTQVPGGLAANGGLLSGLQEADMIKNRTRYTDPTAYAVPGSLNTVVFHMGASMIQIAIGITVGLFLSALIVYPLGKRRSGLFSF